MMSRFEPNSEMYERERIVLEHIKKNSDLHHNALLKLIVPQFMAKTTFEKTRNSLLDKEIISVATKGNMKFYHPTENYEQKSYQHIERTTTNFFHDLKSKIKRLDTDYPHKDIDEKIKISNSLLRNLGFSKYFILILLRNKRAFKCSCDTILMDLYFMP